MTRSIVRFALPLLLITAPSFAQHQERPQDPPGRPARSGGNLGPLTIVKHGPFTSVQVNTNAAGNNIRGDAANEPSIAIDPTNPKRMVIGWRQFDTIRSNFRKNGYAFTTDGGKTWKSPGVVQRNVFNSDPVLDTDLNGNFYYLSYSGGRRLKMFKSTNGGQTFTGPVNSVGGDKAWMVVDKTSSIGKGNIYMIWQTLHGPRTFVRSTNGGRSFSQAFSVPFRPTFGTMDIDPAGTVYCAGLRDQRRSTFVLARSTTARNARTTPTFQTVFVNMGGSLGFGAPPNPGGLLGQVNVSVDPSRRNHVYMLCSVNPRGADPMDVHFVKSTDGGRTFGRPIRVNDDRSSSAWQWLAAMSVAPNGRIDVVWNDTRGHSSTICATYYAYSLDAGTTWSKNVAVGPTWNSIVGHPNQRKIGDYYHMRSDNAQAHLAYAATYNNEQDTYYLRLGDCNGNGVHDGVDLRNGTSFDNNKNGIIDECEFCQKDLGNGSGLKLVVCGDDLSKANARATLQVSKGQANRPAILVLALGRLANPIPLPGGGKLVPDIFNSPSIVATGFVTNARGVVGLPIGSGTGSVLKLYGQAFMLRGFNLATSNATEIRLRG